MEEGCSENEGKASCLLSPTPTTKPKNHTNLSALLIFNKYSVGLISRFPSWEPKKLGPHTVMNTSTHTEKIKEEVISL